jgi:hypothetical protein
VRFKKEKDWFGVGKFIGSEILLWGTKDDRYVSHCYLGIMARTFCARNKFYCLISIRRPYT